MESSCRRTRDNLSRDDTQPSFGLHTVLNPFRYSLDLKNDAHLAAQKRRRRAQVSSSAIYNLQRPINKNFPFPGPLSTIFFPPHLFFFFPGAGPTWLRQPISRDQTALYGEAGGQRKSRHHPDTHPSPATTPTASPYTTRDFAPSILTSFAHSFLRMQCIAVDGIWPIPTTNASCSSESGAEPRAGEFSARRSRRHFVTG